MIVVYYGVNLSLSLPFCLSSFSPSCFPSSSSFTASHSRHPPCFSRSLYAIAIAIAIAFAFAFALCLCPIFIPIRCLPLSFCILNCPYSASFPFLALQLISSRPLLYLIFHFLPVSQSRRVPPALALPLLFFSPSSSSSDRSISHRPSFSSGLYFSAPDVPPVANIVFLPPPLDMAKEAICALLAILGHFFEAFSPLDLFFCPHTLSARILGFSLFSSIPVVVAFCLCPSRFFIDSNLFHLPPVRSFQPSPAPVRPAPCAPGPFLRTRASENHRGE